MEKHWYWLGAFIVVGILLGAGVLFLVTRPPWGEPIRLNPPPTAAPITVYVSGKVNQPGLYSLPQGSRVNDAIQAADGFSVDADRNALNLAELLSDGQQINVTGLPDPTPTGWSVRSVPTYAGMINVNTADLAQLESLPGIGPTLAQAILDYRVNYGPFTRIEDVMKVQGVGQAKFEAIKDLITVGTSP
ncbi:MAG: competence protein ComEA [Anaerolineales bacterium]|nr:ComEA family DNA-binding protein [Anaerolineae bacterium]PWB54097.1 MAG: competence protein ComEA [Anaerolineales bacterium]